MTVCWSSLWNENAAAKALCFQLWSGGDGDPPEEHRSDTVGLHPASSSSVAACGKPEPLITNEVRTPFRALPDSMSQSSRVI